MTAEFSSTRRTPTSGRVKIHFELSAEDRASGVDAENLWAEELGSGKFKIDNIPFYAYGIALGDIVLAGQVDGRLTFKEVIAHSGHSTYRILVKDDSGFESDPFKGLSQRLQELGCEYEVAKRRWIAIDVPPATDVFTVYKLLESGEEQDLWTFEEGHCGHRV